MFEARSIETLAFGSAAIGYVMWREVRTQAARQRAGEIPRDEYRRQRRLGWAVWLLFSAIALVARSVA